MSESTTHTFCLCIAGMRSNLTRTLTPIYGTEEACSSVEFIEKSQTSSIFNIQPRSSNHLTGVARLPELENEVKQLKESLDAANYKLGLADGKIESLQNALKSAESRAATLELQSKSRATTSADEIVELTSAEKDAEVCSVITNPQLTHYVSCASCGRFTFLGRCITTTGTGRERQRGFFGQWALTCLYEVPELIDLSQCTS